tara:strand:- start:279 stop:572 length:294 start_codon:yes stop_codon:yes gene_type:complete
MAIYHPQRNESNWQGTVVDYLTRYECEVQFEKADGTIRDMQCTLQDSIVPATKGTRATKNSNIITVFDTKAQGWRTVKFDKIIEFKVKQHEYIRSIN